MADGNTPARRKPVRVSRDAAGREIRAADAGYSHAWATLRRCELCGRVDLDVLAATATRGAECMSSAACVARAERREVRP